VLKTINKRLKSKTKHFNIGFCKRCGSYHLIGWGGYGRKVRHMYVESERVRARRFRCKKCGKTSTILPDGVNPYKRFGNKYYQEMVDLRCSRGSGYRRLSQRGKIKYCSHVTMWRQMQKVGQQTLNAFFDLGDLPFSGIIIIDERKSAYSEVLEYQKNLSAPMGNIQRLSENPVFESLRFNSLNLARRYIVI
jgi:transposase